MRTAYLLKGIERSFSLLRQGRFRVLAGKLRHRVPFATWPSVSSESIWGLVPTPSNQQIVLVVDTGSGGGSTQYRDRLLDDIRRRGDVPVRLEFDLRSGSPLLRWDAAGDVADPAGRRLADYRLLEVDLVPETLSAVVVGTLARFPAAQDLMRRLTLLTEARDVPLVVDWHDHFLLCPVASLMGRDDYFCGLPDEDECGRCLPSNRHAFDRTLNTVSISEWRRDCEHLLAQASSIRVFSQSSAQLLRRVHGDRFDDKTEVIPHSMDYFAVEPTSRSAVGLHTLGVIGQIGLHKGAAVLVELAREIERRGLDLRIVVIGSLELSYPPGVVRETGAYLQQDLPKILEREAVDLVLFPSVCPETFSFVVHEVMALNLPLAVLPLGAQQEYAAPYAKGLVLPGRDTSQNLDCLLAFADRGYEVAA